MITTLPSLQAHPCSVLLSVFEGPLDLLLHLVEQSRLDITAISLVQVTGQYLAYMRAEDQIDHRALADFISIGARLIELKSRALLPASPEPPAEECEPDPDGLVEMLLEYRRFKEVASLLKEREEDGVRAFPRLAPPPEVPAPSGLGNITLDRLAEIVQRALARTRPPEELPPLLRPTCTVREKIAEIELVLRLSGRVSFSAIVSSCRTRAEIVVAFFAVLELINRGLLAASQAESFGDISLVPATPVTEDDPGRVALEPEFARVQ
jgi:segregation and condensation protein A